MYERNRRKNRDQSYLLFFVCKTYLNVVLILAMQTNPHYSQVLSMLIQRCIYCKLKQKIHHALLCNPSLTVARHHARAHVAMHLTPYKMQGTMHAVSIQILTVISSNHVRFGIHFTHPDPSISHTWFISGKQVFDQTLKVYTTNHLNCVR